MAKDKEEGGTPDPVAAELQALKEQLESYRLELEAAKAELELQGELLAAAPASSVSFASDEKPVKALQEFELNGTRYRFTVHGFHDPAQDRTISVEDLLGDDEALLLTIETYPGLVQVLD